jgi:hypothetical protein
VETGPKWIQNPFDWATTEAIILPRKKLEFLMPLIPVRGMGRPVNSSLFSPGAFIQGEAPQHIQDESDAHPDGFCLINLLHACIP